MLYQSKYKQNGPSAFVFVSLSRNEHSSRCPLRTIPAAHGKRLFICHLNQTKMFVQMDIQVHRRGMLIYNRSLLVEMVCKLFYWKLVFCYNACCTFLMPRGAWNIQRQLLTHLYPGQFRVANSPLPQMHGFGLWKGARVTREDSTFKTLWSTGNYNPSCWEDKSSDIVHMSSQQIYYVLYSVNSIQITPFSSVIC